MVVNLGFQTGIPAGGDFPADDQPIMQNNSDNTFAAFNVDHIPFQVAGTGLHAQVNLPNGVGNSTPKLPVGGTTGCVIYSDISKGLCVPWVNALLTNGNPGQVAPLIGPAGSNAVGTYTTVYNATTIQYGTVTGLTGTAGSNTITFPFAGYVNIPIVLATPLLSGISNSVTYTFSLNTITQTTFKYGYGSSNAIVIGFNWIAIGI